ncbi:MAG TPA: hypothetical protein VFB81_02785 [Myxococcales bacterium]|nr:hypothetical protein [Myxococcales bacterium]
MRTELATAVGLVVLAFLGCGGAKEGGPCSGEVYHCESGSSVLECRDGHWLALPCTGPQGCVSGITGITCDISGNQVGEGCPTAMEGTGFCRGTAPLSLFACRDQQLVKLQDCSSCVVSTNSIFCNP